MFFLFQGGVSGQTFVFRGVIRVELAEEKVLFFFNEDFYKLSVMIFTDFMYSCFWEGIRSVIMAIVLI